MLWYNVKLSSFRFEGGINIKQKTVFHFDITCWKYKFLPKSFFFLNCYNSIFTLEKFQNNHNTIYYKLVLETLDNIFITKKQDKITNKSYVFLFKLRLLVPEKKTIKHKDSYQLNSFNVYWALFLATISEKVVS